MNNIENRIAHLEKLLHSSIIDWKNADALSIGLNELNENELIQLAAELDASFPSNTYSCRNGGDI